MSLINRTGKRLEPSDSVVLDGIHAMNPITGADTGRPLRFTVTEPSAPEEPLRLHPAAFVPEGFAGHMWRVDADYYALGSDDPRRRVSR